MSANQNAKQSFWTTLSGILTGCAGIIGAVAAKGAYGIELLQSPFWVCVDVPGNVYAIYAP